MQASCLLQRWRRALSPDIVKLSGETPLLSDLDSETNIEFTAWTSTIILNYMKFPHKI